MRKANGWDEKSHSFLVFCVCQVNFCRNSFKQIFSHRLIPLLVSLSPSEYICTQEENLIHRTGIIHRKTNSERINQLTENPLTSSTLQCQLFLYIRYLLGRKKRWKKRRRMKKQTTIVCVRFLHRKQDKRKIWSEMDENSKGKNLLCVH